MIPVITLMIPEAKSANSQIFIPYHSEDFVATERWALPGIASIRDLVAFHSPLPSPAVPQSPILPLKR